MPLVFTPVSPVPVDSHHAAARHSQHLQRVAVANAAAVFFGTNVESLVQAAFYLPIESDVSQKFRRTEVLQLSAADVDLYFVAAVTFFLSAQELDFSGDFDHAASPDAAEALRVGRYGSQAALFVARAAFFLGLGGNARGRRKWLTWRFGWAGLLLAWAGGGKGLRFGPQVVLLLVWVLGGSAALVEAGLRGFLLSGVGSRLRCPD